MREASPSCLTNAVNASGLWDVAALEILVFLFSGFRQIRPVKYYGDGDPVFLIFVLNNPNQWVSKEQQRLAEH